MEKTKMTKPIIRIHDQETDEIIEREMTAKEIAELNASIAESDFEREAKLAAKAAAEAKLAALGLTAEDLKALGL